MLKRTLITAGAPPVMRTEAPGWGRFYKAFVSRGHTRRAWSGGPPRIIRDKRCGHDRVVNIAEWTDRTLGHWYDREAAHVVDALIGQGERVLYVGANYGHFPLAATKAVGPGGSVVACEQDPKAFEGVDRVETPMRRLDDIAGPERVHFLKIDVEGYEVHVLRGAAALLERDRPLILTEVVERHLQSAGETRRSLSDLLEARGYRSYRLGLAGRGARQRLCLEEVSASTCDGDFLWVPADRVERVSGFVRAAGRSAHETERAPE